MNEFGHPCSIEQIIRPKAKKKKININNSLGLYKYRCPYYWNYYAFQN